MNNFPNLFPASALSKAGGSEIAIESGNTTINAVDYPVVALNLYGKSVQDGTPTPEMPVPIESVGDDGAVEVTSCGKNLLENKAGSATINGITFAVNNDKSITINGTATASGLHTINSNFSTKAGEKYTISTSANKTTSIPNATVSVISSATIAAVWFSNAKPAVFDGRLEPLHIGIWWDNGAVFENVIIYPQIEVGDTATTYEPYSTVSAEITTALPLRGIPVLTGDGNYTDTNGKRWVCDELIVNADGTGKIIKRTWKETLTQGFEEITIAGMNLKRTIPKKAIAEGQHKGFCNCFNANASLESGNNICRFDYNVIYIRADEYSASELTEYAKENPITVVYILNTPEEIELSAAEMAELMQLQTFNGVTNIYNDEGAEMTLKFATNPLLSEYVKPVVDGIIERFEARIAALEAAVTNT